MASSANDAQVLVLGCGLVAGPMIHYFDSHGIDTIVASRTQAKGDALVASLSLTHVRVVELDVTRDGALDELDALVRQVRVVVSLLPYIYHVKAARVALRHKKHFCTTSYVSAEMETLADEASSAGVLLLNECGVDPGLDHMSAQRVIDDVHAKGGKVLSFTSICGGLPAPEDNDNPYGYKLSWSPRGVLLASRNDAVFLRRGERVSVPGPQLYTPEVYEVDDFGGERGINRLEWYPNRDSVKYRDIYSIPEVQTIIRGTYRNEGWCDTMAKLSSFGFTNMDTAADLAGQKVSDVTRRVLGIPADSADLRAAAAAKLGLPADSDVVSRIEWIGLFDDSLEVPAGTDTVLDVTCFLFERRLQYAPGQKDMICMRHTFEVEFARADRRTITSTLIDIGQQPGFSSMSRTVSLPLACAVRAVLDGRITLTGLHRPVIPELYNPILDEMAELGVAFTEQELPQHIWLRSELKAGEERVPLVPAQITKLLDAGFRVTVERSATRCIADAEYEATGAAMVDSQAWHSAPYAAIILGIKELPLDIEPLVHRHIHFAHCFKNQDNWQTVMSKFIDGRGLLWDLEFLKHENGRRIAAFGYSAGVVGMALGLMHWAHQQTGQTTGSLSSYKTTADLVADVQGKIAAAVAAGAEPPKALVIGALGRCGSGAVWFAQQAGIEPTQWDLEETKGGGPFPQLLDVDVLVNCIYLTNKIDPFLTRDMLDGPRRLSVFSDVSCDYTNPDNPFPVYSQGTTLVEPVVNVIPAADGVKPFDVVAIDHMPTLIPADASAAYSEDFFPHVLDLKGNPREAPVWAGAEQIFWDKVREVGGEVPE